MQSGQQFKIDQPGLIKAGLIPVIVGAIAGLLWIVLALEGIASLLGWIAELFAGVWYIMAKRKEGAVPEQMDGLVNGAILGAVVGLVYGIIGLIASGIAWSGATLGLVSFNPFGIGTVITAIIGGAVAGAVGAFGYSYLVKSGSIK